MRLTALFEAWHLGDGNYPPLHKRQLVNLSFEMLPYSISTDFSEEASRFEPVKDAEYRFVGEVLRVYRSPDGDPIVIIHAGDFRFFINWFPKDVPSLEESDRVVGYGRLLLDHYIWVEYLSRYQDPPDLFYPLKVSRIRTVSIPDSFVTRHGKGKSYPTSLSVEDYSSAAIAEIERMEEFKGDEVFFLVDFDDADVGTTRIPRTFRG